MERRNGRNGVPQTVGRFRLDLPWIWPEFERTDPRTTHHWRDAIVCRREARKGRRLRQNMMARAGVAMLERLVAEHRSGVIGG
ncbi:MAG: hypothetical protein R3D45_06965 [Rhizobiaceae bacterium]